MFFLKAFFVAFFIGVSQLLAEEAVIKPLTSQPQLNPAILDDVTIIVSSCDKYKDLWNPFFDLLFKYWPGLKTHNKHVPIYLIVNNKDFSYPGVNVFKTGVDISWSHNMIDVLKKVKTNYILHFHEDYLLSKPVDETTIKYYLDQLKAKKACYVELWRDNYYIDQPIFESVKNTVIKGKHVYWRNSNQAAMWRKDVFQWLLRPGENPWQFELQGSIRSEGVMEPFLAVMKDAPFEYVNACYLGFIRRAGLDFAAKEGTPIMNPSLPIAEEYPFTQWLLKYPKIHKRWMKLLAYFDPKFGKKS